MTANAPEIWSIADDKAPDFIALADRVFDTPELNFAEFASAAAHRETLEREGFRITDAPAGLPTALMGEAGSGGPVIAILGEYDALPGLSQQPGAATPTPLPNSTYGHGCGHNLLGAAALLAASAVKDYLAANNLEGRVRYYGCPAEEGGSGKGFMVRAGCFDDVDIAISWHPASLTGVSNPISLACIETEFTFAGRSSHAAAAPELGRSALDAVELMNVAANYLREHMPSTARLHYALLDAGGIAPNVVQSRATVRYLVRARELPDLHALNARVTKIAQGAALMTETTMTAKVVSGDANLIGNGPLEALMHRQLQHLGPAQFDDADRAFARQIQATLNPEDIHAATARFGVDPKPGEPLCTEIAPLGAGDPNFIGSTDVGTVSWVVPTVQMRGATCAVGTPFHAWQLVAQGKSPAAHKGMVHAGKAMAATAAELLENPALIAEARSDFEKRRAGRPFLNPIPDDVEPNLPEPPK